MVTGTPVGYVAGTTHIQIPLATDTPRRTAHEPARPKPTGLDWANLRPTCTGCHEKSSEVLEGLCPTCRGVTPTKTRKTKPASSSGRTVFQHLDDDEIARRFTAPTDENANLAADLDQLEHTDPDVAAAAAGLDDLADRATHPDDHVRPEHLAADQPTHTGQENTVTSPPFPTYIVDIAVVLRDSENHPDDRVRVARKAVANALVGLNNELKRVGSPAASTAADDELASPRRSNRGALKGNEADIVRRYQAGETSVDLASAYGVSPQTIRNTLHAHGVELRTRWTTPTEGAATA